MLASISSAVLFGATGHPVIVEVHVGSGLPGFSVVGSPDESVREARDRARAAVMSSGRTWPNRRITVNLAPSQPRKSGSGLDLAIATGVLVASGAIPAEAVRGRALLGELGLDGSVRPVPGVAPMAGVLGGLETVVPVANAAEARVVSHGPVRLVAHLRELVDALNGDAPWPDHEPPPAPDPEPEPPDLADVRGQSLARSALELAAAGGHHTLFVGPPGAGKTMLAARLPGLLPPLDGGRALEATMVHSAAGVQLPAGGLLRRPPFRAPHHTSSAVALIGGGSRTIRPGEISLAHGGVLFLDELAEFAPSVLDGLRQPLEEGVVRVSRAQHRSVMPADFLLVAAMNPCPCGGGPPGTCECGRSRLQRYARRVSGPLLDRFDLRVPVARPNVDELLGDGDGEPTAVVAARVVAARRVAADRQGRPNAALTPPELDRLAPLDAVARALLRHEMERERLSGRGYHRVRRVARTVADLDPSMPEVISEAHVALVLRLRAGFMPSPERGLAA